ncbi:putative transcription regulator containing HTH domain [Hyella patelloides LEGE 07179]|uniref:Putative transcription regulator containing HTH domain n=1 Tax=Hyella patelloides LEGE 07179 TaxID=945734 RepID=A0A563VVU2_9CYAN|nr:helix-turn-helix domain-containing protein [Hyella patelloides]VEP15536.1 putative transcription regulator containing HTH domain [Hyella patelloides LEGE 07179]
MELNPIRTESDYQNALKEIERLFDAEPNSPELDRLDILTTLVEAYEKQQYHIEIPDAISAIFYYLEARGLSKQDLEVFIGSQEQVNAILNKKQPLTLEMIRRLNQDLGIPAEILIQPYSLEKASA